MTALGGPISPPSPARARSGFFPKRYGDFTRLKVRVQLPILWYSVVKSLSSSGSGEADGWEEGGAPRKAS